jgi:hypothetical protein
MGLNHCCVFSSVAQFALTYSVNVISCGTVLLKQLVANKFFFVKGKKLAELLCQFFFPQLFTKAKFYYLQLRISRRRLL